MTRRAPLHARRRRATVLVAAIILLAVSALAVTSAVTATGDDMQLAALRAESIRAFYAAESGVEAAFRRQTDEPTNPLTGTHTLPDGSVFEVVQPFNNTAGDPGTLVVEGRAGRAARRIEIVTE